jgi:hypothetical protein
MPALKKRKLFIPCNATIAKSAKRRTFGYAVVTWELPGFGNLVPKCFLKKFRACDDT